MVSSQPGIAFNHREASDSIDFNTRHGRALQAQAARESMAVLFDLLRPRRSRRIAPPALTDGMAGRGTEERCHSAVKARKEAV